MSEFSAIDLSRLPEPKILERPGPEAILAARKARMIELASEQWDADAVDELRAALDLPSDTLTIALEEDAWREYTLRQAAHEAGVSRLLAFATGATLDHMAAQFGIKRGIVQAADPSANPPIPEVLESDTRLRRRIQLAPEAFTTAGSPGSYIFWAMDADARIQDVDPRSPSPGVVRVVVLYGVGDGTAPQPVLDAVAQALAPRRPLTDQVAVVTAQIVPFALSATLTLYHGPDAEVVRAASEERARAYLTKHHMLGHDITRAGLLGALVVEGVQDVTLAEPVNSLQINSDQAAFCTGVSVVVGGRNV